jgi:transcriptional antiterminator RfaH
MDGEYIATTPQWYVIHTHPRQEERAHSNLRSGGIETFTPKLQELCHNQYTGKLTRLTKHLFPRYIFARFPLLELHKVRYTRGVFDIVSFGNCPTPVGDDMITSFKARIGSDGFVSIGDALDIGDEVVIKGGSLSGLTGIFERQMKDSERVMILLNSLSYQAHIVIERGLVEKKQNPRAF